MRRETAAKVVAATAAGALAVAGCGSSADAYGDAEALARDPRSGGVTCELGGEGDQFDPGSVGATDLDECVGVNDGSGWGPGYAWITVFREGISTTPGVETLPGMAGRNGEDYYRVHGPNWSVWLGDEETAREVHDALGGSFAAMQGGEAK